MAIRHMGEPIDAVDAASMVHQAKGNTAPGRSQAAPSGRNQFHMAHAVMRKWGKPLVFSSGQFWSFTPKTGWTICSSVLSNLAGRLSGRPPKPIIEIMQYARALPAAGAQESCYWEQFMQENGDVSYMPLMLTPNQLLFTDQILDLLNPDMSTSLVGRVVFGPMISLEYGLEDGMEEPACPEFDQLVSGQVPDTEERRHLLELLACGLQPHVPFRGQAILWGKPFCGKTTLATAVGCCPNGRNGLSQIQEEELVRDKFISSGLVNRFYNVSDDSARTSRWTSYLKRYTSGSMIVEPKFHQPETVCPTAMLISTCNELQHLMDSSGAALDRMFAFHLTHPLPKMPGSTDSVKMDARYWSVPARRAGVLSTLVPHLIALRTRNRFDPPKSWLVSMNRAASEADPVAAALVESFKASPEGFVETAALVECLKPTGIEESKLVRMLGGYLERLFGATKTMKKNNSIVLRGYKGICPVEVAEEVAE